MVINLDIMMDPCKTSVVKLTAECYSETIGTYWLDSISLWLNIHVSEYTCFICLIVMKQQRKPTGTLISP